MTILTAFKNNIVLLFFTVILPLSVAAQDTLLAKRPKVAVVLSGGGAKGMAHVGFLKVMQKAGIHPDIIVGTSMGSIVGGYYALGFSPDSIEKILNSTNWDVMLSNKVTLRQVNIDEKENHNQYIMDFPMDKWKPRLPSGAIQGHEIELMLDRLLWSAAKYKNFDDFPIRFRCVSVDILTGKPYVFKKGNLSLALRSSMSIPTVMAPVEYNGMLLVDGGLVNNFPVDVAKKMGADIIIGVYTGGKLLSKEKLKSLINILKQSSLLASIKNARQQRKNCTLYIEPDLTGLNVSDFSKSDSIIARGYKTSMRYFDKLKALSDSINRFAAPTHKKGVLKDSLYLSDYQIKDINDKYTKRMVERFIKNDKPGWHNYSEIENRCKTLFGTKLFAKVGYSIAPAADTTYRITYHFKERNKNTLSFAVNYSNYSNAAIILDLVLRNMYISGSKFEAKVALSSLPKAKFRFTKYLGKKSMFALNTGYLYEESLFPVYNESSWIKSAKYLRKYHNISFNGLLFSGQQTEFSAGLTAQLIFHLPLVESSDQLIKKAELSVQSATFQVLYNRLDKKHFPDKGIQYRFTSNYYINPRYEIVFNLNDENSTERTEHYKTDNFLQFRSDFAAYSKFGKVTMSNEVNLYASFSENANHLNSFVLGGSDITADYYSIPFWGLPKNFALLGSGLLYRVGFRYQFIKNFYATVKANTIFDIYVSDTQPDNETVYLDSKTITGAGIGLSYNSVIGPISFIVSKSFDYGPFWTYVNIGFKF